MVRGRGLSGPRGTPGPPGMFPALGPEGAPPWRLLAPWGTLGVAYQGSLTVLLATGKERRRQPHEPLVG